MEQGIGSIPEHQGGSVIHTLYQCWKRAER